MNKITLVVSFSALAISAYALLSEPGARTARVGAQPASDDRRIDELEKRLDDLSDDVMTLMRARAGAKQLDSKAAYPALKATPKDNRKPNQGNGPGADQLDSRLAALENKLRQRNPFGQWMATTEELETALKLTQEQSTSAKSLFNEVKDQTLELLSIANENGEVPLEQLADDFREGMNFREALDRLVKRMEASIPGTSDTYADRMQAIESGLFDRLEGALTDNQFERLKKANIAPTMIQTGYDPVGEYIRNSLEADGKR